MPHPAYEHYHEATFLDELFEFMKHTTGLNDVEMFKKYVEIEGYDTYAVLNDVNMSYGFDHDKGNIAKLCNISVYSCIVDYIQNKQGPSFGYVFYYWYHYKYLSDEENYHYWNEDDHNGQKPYELYISKTYENIKQEVLQNQLYPIKITNFDIFFSKAIKLFQTSNTKQIKAASEPFLHYDIPVNTPITMSHLLSLVLWCDTDKLSSVFASTFRKSSATESFSSLKNRNREFANWSRLLRESVELFGSSGVEAYNTH
eukprot:206972_1